MKVSAAIYLCLKALLSTPGSDLGARAYYTQSTPLSLTSGEIDLIIDLLYDNKQDTPDKEITRKSAITTLLLALHPDERQYKQ